MSLLDIFGGGDRPSLRQAGTLERELVSRANQLQSSPRAQTLGRLDNTRTMSALVGRGADRRRAHGRVAADVAQATAPQVTQRGSVVDDALNAAKARNQLFAARSDEVDFDLLRERASILGRGARRAGMGLSALQRASSLQEGVAGSDLALKDFRGEMRRDAVGGLVGTGVGLIDPVRELLEKRKTKQTFDPKPDLTGMIAQRDEVFGTPKR